MRGRLIAGMPWSRGTVRLPLMAQGNVSPAMPLVQGKLLGIQIARAVATISVVITHAIAHPLPGAPGVAHLMGRFGVTLFFVVSGFLMVVITGRGSFNPVEFMRRRILRIVPLYYIMMAITLVGVLTAPQIFKDTVYNLKHIVLSALFIPDYHPIRAGLINPFVRLGWTLQFEMFFYVVFASLFSFTYMVRAVAVSALLGLLILLGQFYDFTAAITHFYTQIDTLGFLAGVWLAVFALRREWPSSTRAVYAMLLASGASLAAIGYLYDEIRDNPWTQVWLVATSMVMVGALISDKLVVNPALHKLMVFVGDASYSIYLFHMVAIGFVFFILKHLMPTSFYSVGVPFAACLGLGLGVAVYVLIENPLNRMMRRHRSPIGHKSPLPVSGPLQSSVL